MRSQFRRSMQDRFLFIYEHLEEVNSPLFFHEFIKRAESHKDGEIIANIVSQILAPTAFSSVK